MRTAATPEPQPRWLVLHGVHDSAAAALAAALQARAAPRGVVVQALTTAALLADPLWWLRIDADGSASSRVGAVASALVDGPRRPATASAAPGRLAGVVHRCLPLQLPPDAEDCAYKCAEWNALVVAWLHGLSCPVVNRPSLRHLPGAPLSRARWCQAVAHHGLPTWPLRAAEAWQPLMGAAAGLLVVGDQVFEAAGGAAPCWPAEGHRAAAAAAAACGHDLLAWEGRVDEQGLWRIAGAQPWPDLRPFGETAVDALAARLAGAP